MQVVNFDAGEVFSGKKTGNMVKGWSEPNDYVPPFDASYVPQQWATDIVVWFCCSGSESLYIFGPTGCGKTSALKHFASRLNYPVYEVTAHSRLEFPELVGHHTVVDGNMKFEYGPLSMAMKYGGIFLLNEVDLLDPATAAGLNSVLDGSPLVIPENGGEIIKPHEMFRFAATANSNGSGDASGLYQGVLRQNMAFADRFIFVEAGYLEAQREIALISAKYPGVNKTIVEGMVRYANAVRDMFVGKGEDSDTLDIDITFSTRALLRWAHLIELYSPLRAVGVNVISHALDRALLFRATPATRSALREHAQRIFGSSDNK